MSKSQLDQRLREISKNKVKGDVGIELELEGTLKHMEDSQYWLSKDEGSLRNGIEYVLSRPIVMSDLDRALDALHQRLSSCKPKLSIRCSTHIHVNVLDKTLRQIYTILAFYYLIEDILVSTQGPVRQGNLFCLRMSDAEYISEGLSSSLDSEQYFSQFGMGHYKYGAVNLAAPSKFGSLEFRFLRPIIDMKMMRFWVWLLYNLVENISAYSLKQVVEASMQSPKQFLNLALNKDQIDYVCGSMSEYDLNDLILKNFDHICKLQFHLSRKRKFYIPEEFLDDDLEGSPHRMSRMKKMAQPSMGDALEPDLNLMASLAAGLAAGHATPATPNNWANVTVNLGDQPQPMPDWVVLDDVED